MANFPRRGIVLLAELREHNDREWFQSRKKEIADFVTEPAKGIVAAFEEHLANHIGSPMQSKIYRMHRDVRFSKDKTPYNAYVRFSLAVQGSDCENAVGFHMSIDPDKLEWGPGQFEFSPTRLADFRSKVEELDALIPSGFGPCEPVLKRVPASFPPDHPQEAHLRRKGFAAWKESKWPSDGKDVDIPIGAFDAVLPLYRWLSGLKS